MRQRKLTARMPWLIAMAMAWSAGCLTAQKHSDGSASSSLTYFSESHAAADGGLARSATYVLDAAIGQSVPERADSATYFVRGGFASTLDAFSVAPWLTYARPAYVMPRSSNLLWLSGARLNLGAPTVTVAGRPAPVVASSGTDVAVQMPTLSDPGWHTVTLRNTAGVSSLDRGVAVLPLLYTQGAPASEVEYDIVFRGSQGDVVVWALGVSPGVRLSIAPFLHGLTISASYIKVLPSMTVSASNGEARFRVPATPTTMAIYLQALFLTSNSGYAPGSFSNMLKL